MGLNCRRDQMAWIRFPRTKDNVALGLCDLNGQVVQTVQLHPICSDPTWVVKPPKYCVTRNHIETRREGFMPQGTKFLLRGVPDACLRPFRDFPPEQFEVRPMVRTPELTP